MPALRGWSFCVANLTGLAFFVCCLPYGAGLYLCQPYGVVSFLFCLLYGAGDTLVLKGPLYGVCFACLFVRLFDDTKMVRQQALRKFLALLNSVFAIS